MPIFKRLLAEAKPKCSCCKKKLEKIPPSLRVLWDDDPMDGLYFECEKCGSTLLIPRTKFEAFIGRHYGKGLKWA